MCVRRIEPKLADQVEMHKDAYDVNIQWEKTSRASYRSLGSAKLYNFLRSFPYGNHLDCFCRILHKIITRTECLARTLPSS